MAGFISKKRQYRFRAFLTALLGNGDLNINQMRTDGIFSSRHIFDDATDMDSSYLYDEEVKQLLPEVFTQVVSEYTKERLFVKIHDAYTLNNAGIPIVPAEPTLCALYFIRNPLDVAGSFANHNAGPIDEAIHTMNKPRGTLAKQKRPIGEVNTNNQFAQLMLSWSGHAESWTAPEVPFPVMVLRYEDMLHDQLNTFSKAVAFMGLDKTREQIEKAIFESRFEKLKEQEKEKGFMEKNRNTESFFRSGKAGGWMNELTPEQVKSIVDNHREVMEKYNYPIPDLANK
ncbi:sulfotransferase domain-containing protein [Mucilaginibacter sp. S1162]|uniref:Sulfotransferase domain-containing protein n=1 Tax=Mucilaginibacter humi TaxID=2732510 RepID=A0ABX1W0P9_9SPHI|nr:sulfotransferase domain-containing protein [Mucilaginibacter humi]NNU33231.1 sulfotransferase domain-containing protein [Mucilaginibacter humi]